MTVDHKLFDQAARHFLDEYSHSGSIETLHQIRPTNIDTQLILNYYEELQAAEPMRLLRLERNLLLQQTDWRMTTDYPYTDQDQWASYRTALRNLPATSEPTLDESGKLIVDWPIAPDAT